MFVYCTEITSVVQLVVLQVKWERRNMPSRMPLVVVLYWRIRRECFLPNWFIVFTSLAPMQILQLLATQSATSSWVPLQTRYTIRWSKWQRDRESAFNVVLCCMWCLYLQKEKWLYRGSNSGSLACQASVLATALYSPCVCFSGCLYETWERGYRLGWCIEYDGIHAILSIQSLCSCNSLFPRTNITKQFLNEID